MIYRNINYVNVKKMSKTVNKSVKIKLIEISHFGDSNGMIVTGLIFKEYGRIYYYFHVIGGTWFHI